MNKNIISFLLLFFAINFAFSQNDYAAVNIYRTTAFCIGCKVNILVNDVFLTKIENGGRLELKVFNTKNTKFTITDGASYRDDITISLSKGKVYYFNSKAKLPRIKGFEFEQLSKPVKNKKLKSNRFISMSDVGLLDNNTAREPDTEWDKKKLKEYWSINGAKNIEGIYEKIGTYLEYELAVFKENNEYKIIYLSGASGTNWNEGDIKATLQKTAKFGIFKANWFMLNKSFNDDMIITFEEARMKMLSENGRDKDLYLKIYPAYDESNSDLSSSDWKSSGTGFFIDKTGYLVTNNHVVDNGNTFEVSVTVKGKTITYQAEIIKVDKKNDLAILKINDNNFSVLSSLNYNFDTEIQDTGSSVFALGYPLTQIMGNEIKFTDGKISSKSGFQGDITTYQISVPIQPGNSGGPLFDEKGNLVGITSSGIDRQIADNANYAIKTSYLKLLIDSIDEKLELPSSNEIKNLSVPEQVKIMKEYVVLIKVK